MCGIVGYVGSREGAPIVLSGLRRLEYRGYDSAGIASILHGDNCDPVLKITKAEGKIDDLANLLKKIPLRGSSSIGHTRWATHGVPSKKNAHPHRVKDVVVVHNGIIENYYEIKTELKKKGQRFNSDTDSEVIAHLLYLEVKKTNDFEAACRRVVKKLKGAYAIAAFHLKSPDKLFVAKQECPMVLGLGESEKFVASDVPALLEYTRDFIFLDDGEVGFIEPNSIKVINAKGERVIHKVHHINWSIQDAEKGGYEHFMIKEIYEQPKAIRDTIGLRIKPKYEGVRFEDCLWTDKRWASFSSINIVACGTAWHAALVGKYWIEKFARMPVEVELASEYRYRNPAILPKSLCIAVSQSGETADTLAALSEGKKLKQTTMAVTNVVESTIARRADKVIYTHAGPEISVASTKAFTSQLTVLFLLAVKLAESRRTQKKSWIEKVLRDLSRIPSNIEKVLKSDKHIRQIANKYKNFDRYFYLGRGLSYPLALEGALKLKEIAYINTQAYPAGEMKHGPIALISSDWPVVCVAPDGKNLEKMISNIEEVKSREGRIIAIGTEGNKALKYMSDEWIGLPKVRNELSPFLSAVALQFYAYHMSALKGCDVDKPKNLAKSVTVE